MKAAEARIKDRLSDALDEAVRDRARVVFTDDQGNAVGAVIGPDDLALLSLIDEVAELKLANEALAEAEQVGFVSATKAKHQPGLE